MNPQTIPTQQPEVALLLQELGELVAVLKAPRAPVKDGLWNCAQVAEFLSVPERHVRERLSKVAGFPPPLWLPNSKGEDGDMRWREATIRAYALELEERAIDLRRPASLKRQVRRSA